MQPPGPAPTAESGVPLVPGAEAPQRNCVAFGPSRPAGPSAPPGQPVAPYAPMVRPEPGSSIRSNASDVLAAVKGLGFTNGYDKIRLVTLAPRLTVTLAVGITVPVAVGTPPVQLMTMSPTSSVRPSARNVGGTATLAWHWNEPVPAVLTATGALASPAKRASTANAVIHLRKFISFSL